MTTETDAQNELIQSFEGNLSPEQVAQLLELSDGDTTATAVELGNEPDITTANGKGEQATPAAGEGGEPDPAKAVLLAKDGIHTIPYDKLVEAREGEKHWKAQHDAAQVQLQTLQAEAKARAEAGAAPTVVDNQAATAQAAIEQGVDASIFGDFSEEALAKGMRTLAEQNAALIESKIEARVQALVDKALQPLHAQQATSATESHYGAIYAAHPDADSIAESKELSDWIATQPTFVRDAYSSVLEKGTTEQVIEMLGLFKQANGITQPTNTETSAETVKAAAKAALAKASTPIPVSLSDFPGGRAGAGATRDEALAEMTGSSLVDAMHDMTPEQIETFLSRRV